MKLATIGWEDFIGTDNFKAGIGTGPVANYALHRDNSLSLEDIVTHIRETRPDFVILDADAFREIADCVEAVSLRK